jgi:hypothetical protein
MKEITPADIQQIYNLKQIQFFINFVKAALYLCSCVLTYFERKKIIQEIASSPLVDIDETLTEDLYKNIISQSKDPDNHALQDEYRRLTINKTNSTKRSRSLNVTNETAESSINKQFSINVNPLDYGGKSERTRNFLYNCRSSHSKHKRVRFSSLTRIASKKVFNS